MPNRLRDVLRLVGTLLIVALVTAACGGNEEPIGAPATTAVADDAQDVVTPTSVEPVVLEEEAVGSPVEIEDTFARQNGDIQPLNGRPLDDETLLNIRPIAVKIDNDEKARPQYGIEDADIVYEILVENQITRFLAIFHSNYPELVGPVRSARSSDIDLMAPLANPLFAYSGSNDIVGQEVRTAQANGLLVSTNFDQANSAYIDRDDRPAPHHRTLFPAKLNQEQFTTAPIVVRPVFRYMRLSDEPVADAIDTASFEVSTNERTPAVYTWNNDELGWERVQAGTPHLTESGAQLTPANVVVLEIDYTISRADAASPQAITTGTGAATVFTDGQRIEGRWQRTVSSQGFDILDSTGKKVRMQPGQTFVHLSRPGDLSILGFGEFGATGTDDNS